MDEVAIIERLQAEVGELQVTFRLDCGAEKRQIELPEFRCEQLQFDAFADERIERGWIEIHHLALRRPVVVLGIDIQEGQRLGAQFIEQQPCGHVSVVGFFLNQSSRAD